MDEEFSNFEEIQDAFPNNYNGPNESSIDFGILSQIRTNHELIDTTTSDDIQNKLEVLKRVFGVLSSHLNSYLEVLKNNTKRLETPKIDEKISKNIGKKKVKEIYSYNSKQNEDIISDLLSHPNDDYSIKREVLIDILNSEFGKYYSSFILDEYVIQKGTLIYSIDTFTDLLKKIEEEEFEKLSTFERNSEIGKNKVKSVLKEFKTKALDIQNEFKNIT
jgi:hypothetical protein